MGQFIHCDTPVEIIGAVSIVLAAMLEIGLLLKDWLVRYINGAATRGSSCCHASTTVPMRFPRLYGHVVSY